MVLPVPTLVERHTNALDKMVSMGQARGGVRLLYISPYYKFHSFIFEELKKRCPHFMSEVTTAESSYLMLQNLSFLQVIDSHKFNLLGNQSFDAVFIERCADLQALSLTSSMMLEPNGFIAVVDPDSYEIL